MNNIVLVTLAGKIIELKQYTKYDKKIVDITVFIEKKSCNYDSNIIKISMDYIHATNILKYCKIGSLVELNGFVDSSKNALRITSLTVKD